LKALKKYFPDHALENIQKEIDLLENMESISEYYKERKWMIAHGYKDFDDWEIELNFMRLANFYYLF